MTQLLRVSPHRLLQQPLNHGLSVWDLPTLARLNASWEDHLRRIGGTDEVPKMRQEDVGGGHPTSGIEGRDQCDGPGSESDELV